MSFETVYEPEHNDRLSALHFNDDNSKLVSASVDRRVVIYEVDPLDLSRKQIEGFAAHDADIRDVKWFHPTTGTHFVTLGNDLQMRIWSQDPYQEPNSGRRFKRAAKIESEQLIPFVSMDVKTIGDITYIVVIDRQGLLSLYEPTNPDEYNDWTLVDRFHVCLPVPSRNDQTSFRVQFDPNPFSVPFSQAVSDDEQQLSIIVAAMNEVKLYRSSADPSVIGAYANPPQQNSQTERSASHRLVLFEVYKFYSTPSQGLSLVRDVAFSPSSLGRADTIAIASMDGTVAIYDIHLSPRNQTDASVASTISTRADQRSTLQTHQSNLTSALHPATGSSVSVQHDQTRSNHPFAYKHYAQPLSILEQTHTDAWSVRWNATGELLISSGSDGSIKMWRRQIDIEGQVHFELYAEQAEDDEDSGAELSEDDD